MTRSEISDAAGDKALWQSWWEAAKSDPVATDLPQLYADLDKQIATHEPQCFTSGRCCQFDTFEHRLYVTALEVAWFVSKLNLAENSPADNTPALTPPKSTTSLHVVGQRDEENKADDRTTAQKMLDAPGRDACPFQVDNKCSTHAIRPHGCRIFYCQAGSEVWQHDMYEQYLRRLREMHDELGLAYQYIEWRYALQQAATYLPISERS